ncbi:hypothetical protein A1O3_04178 [Capronia epimyces CBS 606.96]|uniref:Uncharacterized protein n=1 Tax=Capronia epimyces CBS 606.96 TaxID=1182542 RepID=W9YY41_9EURO|nr:uncharacterized protein A1O3_04178 [Capronia epimyces CBS 606.96]EXJ87219.1 hypothetical protein A1O3_04178 [Capronia epimyces CBS 606.96]
MSVPEYHDQGPVKIPASVDLNGLAGKSVLVTGGASGLGKAYSEAFAKAGAYVTVVDLNESLGNETVAQLKGSGQFVKCDVTNWDQQVSAFEAAVQNSPHKSLDIVIANAGIVGQDDMFTLEDPTGPPQKPNLKTMEINLTGVLYTTKLAIHYFRRQPVEAGRDRCLILKSSLAGYVDLPGSIQYNSSKFGVRGLMRSLRRTSWKENIRVNLVAPWYIRTPILPAVVQEYLDNKGVGFALVEDCVRAMLLIGSDQAINGA